ncbi:MAG TPA: hypothetical protein VGF24_00390 [Vicinamibacterales bacterium]
MTWKLYALLSGGAFVATYLVSAPGTLTPAQPRARSAATTVSPQVASDVDMQALANHLASRVRDEASYRAPTRNPFEFVEHRAQPKQVIAPKPIEAPPAFVPPPPPSINLTGVASDHVDGALQRTAIFSSPNGVVLAREGEMVGGIFRVVTIDEDAATLEQVSDGTKLRLLLRH